jgi:hypothetical protein
MIRTGVVRGIYRDVSEVEQFKIWLRFGHACISIGLGNFK